MFPKSKSITIRIGRSIERLIKLLYESKVKVFRVKSTASVFCSFVKFTHDKSKNKQYFHRGYDCISKFCEIMKNILEELNIKKDDTIDNHGSWKICEVCYSCCKKFDNKDKNYRKLKNHCHFTGK